MDTGFADAIKTTLDGEVSVTENGAVGYASAGSELLTMNFMLSSLRNESADAIAARFARVYFENPDLAVRFLFFVGDVRGGCGERRTFRICMDWLVRNAADKARKVLSLVPEYTRWDNLVRLVDSPLSDDVVAIVADGLSRDMESMRDGGEVSLLAKWMPSENASSPETKRLARTWIEALGTTPRKYRNMLSKLRRCADVVETKMSAGRFSEIDYARVPSRANLLYKDAFDRRDHERRAAYLEAVASGDAKINASEAVFPHDILHKLNSRTVATYVSGKEYSFAIPDDQTVELMWKNLPNKLREGESGVMCVVDSSGSMASTVGKSSVTAWEAAHALGFYFAERCKGAFRDKYITFSLKPSFVDMANCSSLKDRLLLAHSKSLYSSTDIEAVFDLVLKTAVDNHMGQEDLPSTVLIFSDCEFDAQCCAPSIGAYDYNSSTWDAKGRTLFDAISRKFAASGYAMPRLVFWNLCSRTGTVPLQTAPSGVTLVSGFSANNLDMVMSNELDPYKALVKKLDSPRYEPVALAISK